jgi:hypothetical protein
VEVVEHDVESGLVLMFSFAVAAAVASIVLACSRDAEAETVTRSDPLKPVTRSDPLKPAIPNKPIKGNPGSYGTQKSS